eukprot:CAMPEP_0184313532 /NCGR_PEP_ID=MMETSP1049-20130417/64522_1 /TAXON_ID=77928 /ORGANISM="Proteomonas sulcata, Strain CCMP704" /LENGTH=90 /DNA_ID=CAMNT_0026630847 /DNA_START=464 /DNA_END=734 /DNA_ORIENTATION=-
MRGDLVAAAAQLALQKAPAERSWRDFGGGESCECETVAGYLSSMIWSDALEGLRRVTLSPSLLPIPCSNLLNKLPTCGAGGVGGLPSSEL